jgi:hypothetical protein
MKIVILEINIFLEFNLKDILDEFLEKLKDSIKFD